MYEYIAIFQNDIPDSLDPNSAIIPDHYKLSDDVLLLRSIIETPKGVAAALGMYDEKGAPEHPGVLFALQGSYFGYADDEVWNWLQTARESAYA